ncbi:MAG: hypothetical protein AVDCRST_MAG20-1953, partial [uncultured Acidimicrobiales bacterium]
DRTSSPARLPGGLPPRPSPPRARGPALGEDRRLLADARHGRSTAGRRAPPPTAARPTDGSPRAPPGGAQDVRLLRPLLARVVPAARHGPRRPRRRHGRRGPRAPRRRARRRERGDHGAAPPRWLGLRGCLARHPGLPRHGGGGAARPAGAVRLVRRVPPAPRAHRRPARPRRREERAAGAAPQRGRRAAVRSRHRRHRRRRRLLRGAHDPACGSGDAGPADRRRRAADRRVLRGGRAPGRDPPAPAARAGRQPPGGRGGRDPAARRRPPVDDRQSPRAVARAPAELAERPPRRRRTGPV